MIYITGDTHGEVPGFEHFQKYVIQLMMTT